VESAFELTPLELEAGSGGPAVSVLDGGAARVDARLSPPVRPAGLVPRRWAVHSLLESHDLPVALLVAPPGYGKTTVLSEWAERDARPFAWVRLDAEDRHPASLLSSIAGALDVTEPVGKGVRTSLSSRRPDATRRALSRLLRYLSYREQPVVLVLDDFHVLHGTEALPLVQAIADGMPPGSQLALASRHEPELAVGSLRAHRKVVEVRTGELAMARTEAADLLEAAGLHLGAAELTTLVRRTEGWAAGLYLAALSLREDRDVRAAVSRFGGADHLVADYLRDEFLTPLGDEKTAFLMRTSVLDTLSSALCDAVLESSGSGRILAELARSGALLISLDRNGDSYRHHPLFAQMLRSELRRLEPRRESQVHRLASAWYGAHREQRLAIRHAVAAGELAAAGDLV
jgi:LuxR family transcriptional regulator, maltose regulon positive regulatory protein